VFPHSKESQKNKKQKNYHHTHTDTHTNRVKKQAGWRFNNDDIIKNILIEFISRYLIFLQTWPRKGPSIKKRAKVPPLGHQKRVMGLMDGSWCHRQLLPQPILQLPRVINPRGDTNTFLTAERSHSLMWA
jgi:hypothetical protein